MFSNDLFDIQKRIEMLQMFLRLAFLLFLKIQFHFLNNENFSQITVSRILGNGETKYE